MPAELSRDRDRLAHAEEERKDKQLPRLDCGTGWRKPAARRKGEDANQKSPRRKTGCSMLSTLKCWFFFFFYPPFPKFLTSRGLGAAAQQGSSLLSMDCIPCPTGFQQFVEKLYNETGCKSVISHFHPPTPSLFFCQVSQINWFQLFFKWKFIKIAITGKSTIVVNSVNQLLHQLLLLNWIRWIKRGLANSFHFGKSAIFFFFPQWGEKEFVKKFPIMPDNFPDVVVA